MQNILRRRNEFLRSNARNSRRVAALFAVCVTVLSVITTIFAPFLTSSAAFADSSFLDGRTVKAGVFHFEGYHMKDENGVLTGYGIEFLKLVSEYSKLNFQFTGYDNELEETYNMLERGEIDVITSISKTDERLEKYGYSYPMGRKRIVLSKNHDNKTLTPDNYAERGDLKIGELEGNTANELLKKFAEDRGFTYTAVQYKNSVELATALQNNEIDAICTSDLRKADNEDTLDIVAETDFYAIVRKDDTLLLDEINYAIKQMDIYEGDWQNQLHYRFYSPNYAAGQNLTVEEKAYIEKLKSGEKKLTVTALGNRAPYSYAENGELKGIIPDYFEEIMKKAGLSKSDYTAIVPESAEKYNELINSHRVDVVLDSTKADDIIENAEYNGFNTDNYMTARIAMVAKNNLDVEKIKVVAVSDSQRNEVNDEFLKSKGYEILKCPSGEDAVRRVLENEADAAYVYTYTAQLAINYDYTNSLYYTVVSGTSTGFSMHIDKYTDHELVTILKKCIAQMSYDALNQLVSKYTSYKADSLNVWQYLLTHPQWVVVIFVALTAIVCVTVGLYLYGRFNKKLLDKSANSNRIITEQLSIVQALSRDYVNVFSVDCERGVVRIIKMDGYVPKGMEKGSTQEYDYADTLDRYIGSRVYPKDRKEMARALSLDNIKRKLTTDDSYFGTYRISVDGEISHYQYSYFKVADKDLGQSESVLVGFRNIDEVIQKEQEQQKVLSEALAQAQYASKAKTNFLNNMSHDIRTPMNAIIGFTSLAASHIGNTEQVKDYLGKIMISGKHLLSLINDVLDMSRIESGKVQIEEKEVSLSEIMHDLKTIVQSDVKSKQLEFYIDVLDVVNERVICDKLRLNQVLLNILSNAIKYTKPGGMVSVRVIQTANAPDGSASYEFRIKDSGIGMSKEFLKHVFEPFEREHSATVNGIQGTGLGLAITKNIVNMMGGSITVDSEYGKGSEFTVRFCFKLADAPAETQSLEHLRDLRALVVDDDANTCMSVSKMLTSIGMRPDWTTSGREAIVRVGFATEQRDCYSAYIIDWLMPDMNGIELVRRIRKKIANTAPIIILTAYDWSDIEAEAKEAGVTAFCSKPLFLSELRSVLAAPFGAQKAPVEKSEPRFDGMKLLLVEDNEFNLEIAQTILEAAGFAVDTANDGCVAIERIKEVPADAYDLILMDIQMPVMNGYEVTRAIRAMDDRAKATIPIIAMTANAFDEDKNEAAAAGMNGFASKPIEIEKLMQMLDEILGRRAERKERK